MFVDGDNLDKFWLAVAQDVPAQDTENYYKLVRALGLGQHLIEFGYYYAGVIKALNGLDAPSGL